MEVLVVIKLHFMIPVNPISPWEMHLGAGTVNTKVCVHSDIKGGSEELIALTCPQRCDIKEPSVPNHNFIHWTLESALNPVITLIGFYKQPVVLGIELTQSFVESGQFIFLLMNI